MLSGVEPKLLSAFVRILAPIEAAGPLFSCDYAAAVIAFEGNLVGKHLDLFTAVGTDDRLRDGLEREHRSWATREDRHECPIMSRAPPR